MQRPILTLKGKLMTPVQSAREKIAQLEAEAKELTAKKDALRAEVLAELQKEITALGFTKDELFPPQKPQKPNKTDKPAMYRDSATGATWTGFGKKPNWLKAAEAAGKKKEQYRV